MAEVIKAANPPKQETLDELKARIEKEARSKVEEELRGRIEVEIREKINAEQAAKANPAAIQPGPRYRTIGKCYHTDILWEDGQEFTYFGVPGPHMTPLNEEAREAMIKHKIMDENGKLLLSGNPVVEMTQITPSKA